MDTETVGQVETLKARGPTPELACACAVINGRLRTGGLLHTCVGLQHRRRGYFRAQGLSESAAGVRPPLGSRMEPGAKVSQGRMGISLGVRTGKEGRRGSGEGGFRMCPGAGRPGQVGAGGGGVAGRLKEVGVEGCFRGPR